MSMKKVLGVLTLCFSFFLVLAQDSEVRSVGSFTGVKVGEAIDVYLKKGDKESVKVEVTGGSCFGCAYRSKWQLS